MKTFQEYIEEQQTQAVSDHKGPGGGKLINQIHDVETHLKCKQHHSTRFNEVKSGKEHGKSAEHVRDAALKYHTDMYKAHKAAVEELGGSESKSEK
jgi:hypothetical protein